jgi:hypothetical protein
MGLSKRRSPRKDSTDPDVVLREKKGMYTFWVQRTARSAGQLRGNGDTKRLDPTDRRIKRIRVPKHINLSLSYKCKGGKDKGRNKVEMIQPNSVASDV